MSDAGFEAKGACLCGAVKFTATAQGHMDVCHCSMCRRWTGGVFMGVSCSDVQIEDESALGVYASSEHGERCFCKTCGSSFMWRSEQLGFYSVSAQAFEDPAAFDFTTEIFIDSKPANYDFANPTQKLTAAEVMAMFSSEGAPE
ncbi:GFA family protein [Limoniibacter endophyticus]|uniref:Aldehyde-activating protein n=1 Tax=Limoniibacter endophyticus TaxID=1565040 RepID=A0A8J3GFU0_9HYPH|nr:GFA family protein [Limoniibacter endophyticus]GHC60353.1 aldehyde-activating protein [Limoniibacter endophyticus]